MISCRLSMRTFLSQFLEYTDINASYFKSYILELKMNQSYVHRYSKCTFLSRIECEINLQLNFERCPTPEHWIYIMWSPVLIKFGNKYVFSFYTWNENSVFTKEDVHVIHTRGTIWEQNLYNRIYGIVRSTGKHGLRKTWPPKSAGKVENFLGQFGSIAYERYQ